jgi:PAS domain-containing protein
MDTLPAPHPPAPGSARGRLSERRRRQPSSTPVGYLRQLPALILLDRLPTPMLAVGLDGMLAYANPACARLLGHTDTAALTGRSLPALLAGHAHTPAHDCITALRAPGGAVIDWCHARGYPVRTRVSDPLLLRADDPVLLVTISDLTDWLWTTAEENSRQPSDGQNSTP